MSDTEHRVVFMGSPDFAVPSLEALCASGRYRPVLVVSQPDRPSGRGRRTIPTPVRRFALDRELETATMSKENYAEVVAQIRDLQPDVVIVVAFGIIIKRDLLDMPRHGCVNVHASLLPKFRGVSPIQAALVTGEAVTGCTTMIIDEGIDTGDTLVAAETPIEADDTAGTLTDRLAQLGAGLLVQTLDGLFDGLLGGTPQPESPTPYTKKIRKRHGEIKWEREAADVERRIRAMTPWPSAYTFVDGARLIVTQARVAEGSGEPGRVLSLNPLVIACGEGALELLQVKPEGKRAMSAEAFVAGHSLAVGDALGGN